MSTHPFVKVYLNLLFIFLFGFFSQASLYSDDADWTNEGAGTFWGSADNWDPNIVPEATDTATFNNVDSGGTTTVNGETVATLAITAGTHTFERGLGELNVNDINITNTGSAIFGNTSINANTINKSGTGTLTFQGENPVVTTNLNAGTLLLDDGSTLYTDMTQNGGTLTSAGADVQITGNLNISEGVVSLNGNNDLGTLIVTENFTLGANATYNLTLSGLSGRADLIDAKATATLIDGNTIALTLLPGRYPEGTTFNIITATNPIVGTITNIQGEGSRFSVATVGRNVVLTVLQNETLLPVSLNNLNGNSQALGNYIFLNPDVADGSADLTSISDIVASLSPDEFLDSLVKLGPVSVAAIPQTGFQNNVQIAVVLDKQFQKNVRKKRAQKAKRRKKDEDYSCYNFPQTGLFIEPIGIFYNQRKTGNLTNAGQVGFNAYSYGAGLGWEQVLNNQFIVEGGIAYTHSNLDFDENFGNSRWSSIYIAPFFGWFNQKAFANFMVMGAFNFVRSNRRVSFTGVERLARSHYVSYDVLLRANAGLRFNLGKHFLLMPEATLNYVTVFTPNYSERDAGSISLVMQNNTNYIMQPSFRMRLTKEFITHKFCYAPNIYVGWLANVLLKNQTLSARFRDAPNNLFFTINGYSATTNQLILGAEFYAQRFNQFLLTSNFEVDMLSRFEIYTVKIKFEWMF